MLEIPRAPHSSSSQASSDGFSDIRLDELVRAILMGLKRQWALIACCVVAMVAIALLFVLTATPTFTASSSLIIDPRVTGVADRSRTGPTPIFSDALVVDSEVQVIRSNDLALRVIAKLDLMNNPSYMAPPSFLAQGIYAVTSFVNGLIESEEGLPPVNSEAEERAAQENALSAFQRQLNVTRDGDTYVIDVSFSSPSPFLAAQVANAVTDEYLLSQAEATYENTRRVNEWLGGRIQLLSANVIASDRAVEDYKQQNNLFNVQDDRLPNAQELTVANDQLIAVRGQIVSVQANIDQIESLIASGEVAGGVNRPTTTTGNTTLDTLLAEYGRLVSRERDLTGRFGPTHLLAQRARSDILVAEQSIRDEYRRTADQNRNQLAVLRSQETDYLRRIGELQLATGADQQKLIRLRELEREASSNRVLYEAMLANFQQSTQEETFQSSPARVIAKAVAPTTKSAPRSKVIVALGLVGGFMLGAGAAFLREQMDDVFRAATSSDDTLGVPLLGIVPFFGADRRVSARNLSGMTGKAEVPRRPPGLEKWPRRALTLRFAVDQPMSIFAETLRSASFGMNYAKSSEGCRVVGVTSVSPGEGKSTLSANFASYLAHAGNKVALIDYDVRHPSLTRLLLPDGKGVKLGDLLRSETGAEVTIEPHPVLAGATFIGNDGLLSAHNPSDMSYVRAMETLIEELRRRFDIVILDLPPAANLVDARVAATVTDHILFSVEWGRTKKSFARNVVYSSPQLRSKLFGVVYSKVKLSAYNKYNMHTPGGYYQYTHG